MMFIDASVLVAILTREHDDDELVARFEKSSTRLTSAIAVWETTVAISRILSLSVDDATSIVESYLDEMEIVSVAIPPETAALALQAFDRFGKGRHPAKLNFGDCFAYACAVLMKQPLLFKGEDFTLTDIEVA